jgi:CHAT domain-containing protein
VRPGHELEELHPAANLEFAKQWLERTANRNPYLLSGLVLAGANRDAADGVLLAEQMADLDLRGCDMVVLSACETALGKAVGGEGVLGMQRALETAGVRTSVTSLWQIDDAATAVLMEHFYENLWKKKMSKLEALRQAQLAVLWDPERVRRRQRDLAQRGGTKLVDLPEGGRIDGTRPRRSPPAWWAAFVLSGDGK